MAVIDCGVRLVMNLMRTGADCCCSLALLFTYFCVLIHPITYDFRIVTIYAHIKQVTRMI